MLMRKILKVVKKPIDTEEVVKKLSDEKRESIIGSLKSLKRMQLIYYEHDAWHLTQRGLDLIKRMKARAGK